MAREEKLAEAWRLFDIGDYAASEKIYQECLKEINTDDYETYASVLMGLVYTQSFLEKYDEARNYAKHLTLGRKLIATGNIVCLEGYKKLSCR